MDLILPLFDRLTVDDFDPVCQLHDEFGVLNPLGLYGGEPTDGEGGDWVVIKRHFDEVGGQGDRQLGYLVLGEEQLIQGLELVEVLHLLNLVDLEVQLNQFIEAFDTIDLGDEIVGAVNDLNEQYTDSRYVDVSAWRLLRSS